MKFLSLVLTFLLAAIPLRAAEPLRIAVAANFLVPAEQLAAIYTEETGTEILISSGSTGALYAQIVNGAPFDLFLSADKARPEALVEAGVTETIQPYALGTAILVTRGDMDDPYGKRIAVTDPTVAPYGVAAMEAIAAAGQNADELDLIYGGNLSQTAGFLVSGNVDVAYLALSQSAALLEQEAFIITSLSGQHAPVEQYAAVISDHADITPFLDLMASPEGAEVLARFGYAAP